MSSPSRQVGNRRLPPLPSGSRHSPSNLRASSGHHASSPVSVKAAKGHASNRSPNNHGGQISHIDLTASFGDGPFRPALVQGKAIGNGQGRVITILVIHPTVNLLKYFTALLSCKLTLLICCDTKHRLVIKRPAFSL